MNMIDIINKKRQGQILSKEEIAYAVNGYVAGTVPDYQMSSLLMAIVLKKMTNKEIFNLTEIMLNSGGKMSLGEELNAVDKHSTGGVGDKTTLIVAPLVASCGVNVAKMSGKGLGYTGGTIDKLESIPGFKVKVSMEEFKKQVKEIGVAVVSQTDNLVPADKKIYALRDVTGTVESNALIASSIMSKKIASGAKNIVIDVKVGTGALIKDRRNAQKLSELMIKIGKEHDVNVVCVITNMNAPLGDNVGNSLEVLEAIDVLKNNKEGNLKKLCVELAANMVSLGKKISYKQAKKIVIENLENGKAYKKFLEFVKYQNGDIKALPVNKQKIEIKVPCDGYIEKIDALELGILSTHLGAGLENLDDKLDYSAGIIVKKNISSHVSAGETILELYTNKEINLQELKIFDKIIKISPKKVKEEKLIFDIIK